MEQPFQQRQNGRNVESISRCCLPEICCMRRLLAENVALSENADKSRAEDALCESGLYRKRDFVPVEKQVLREFCEDGFLFSEGQKQKTLARACYYNTEFLIADEAAASLDPFAEDAFNKTLLQGHPDQGVLVISHRLSVTALTDRIYVMEHGRITSAAAIRSFLAQKGRYWKMWGEAEAGDMRETGSDPESKTQHIDSSCC